MIDGLFEPILHAMVATARFVGGLLDLGDFFSWISGASKNRWWERMWALLFSLIVLVLVVASCTFLG